MILIITHKEDYTADFLINQLNQKGLSYKRFNTEDILHDELTVNYQSDELLNILGEGRFDAVWFRRVKLPRFNGVNSFEQVYLQQETEAFLKGLFTIIKGKWLSDPFAVYRAEYKLLQLRTAKELGFEIPKTLLTNSKIKLQKFIDDCGGEIIVKPIAQTRIEEGNFAAFIYTSKITAEVLQKIGEFDLTPCIFQEKIEKALEYRVTVVNNEVFTAAVNSQLTSETEIDWRRKNLSFFKADLPDHINILCTHLVKVLGLNFGAIDLIKTPDDRYVFLEINPNGQWAWLEIEAGLPISNAIINYLTNEKDHQSLQ